MARNETRPNLTLAERQRQYRERLAAMGYRPLTALVPQATIEQIHRLAAKRQMTRAELIAEILTAGLRALGASADASSQTASNLRPEDSAELRRVLSALNASFQAFKGVAQLSIARAQHLVARQQTSRTNTDASGGDTQKMGSNSNQGTEQSTMSKAKIRKAASKERRKERRKRKNAEHQEA